MDARKRPGTGSAQAKADLCLGSGRLGKRLRHDSAAVRNFGDKIALCDYFRFARLPRAPRPSLPGSACGPFGAAAESARPTPTPGAPSRLALLRTGAQAHQQRGVFRYSVHIDRALSARESGNTD